MVAPNKSPLDAFIEYHGYETTKSFEKLLVQQPSIAFNERWNRTLKENIRNKATVKIDLAEAYCIQNDSKKRIALYECIVDEMLQNYSAESTAEPESQARKRRRLDLTTRFSQLNAETINI